MSEPSANPSLDAKFAGAHAKIDALDSNVVDVVMAVADVGGGGTVGLLSAQVKDQYGFDLAKECVFLIYASDTEFHGPADPNANVTLDTVTEGSIVASSAADGWWLVKTDATGLFGCNANNSIDQTVWFNAASPRGGVDATASGVTVRSSVPDSAAWSA